MAMELHRRLRNSSCQLTLRAKSEILKKYVDKLRMSGYCEKSTDGIIESGTSFYFRKLRIDLQGGPCVNVRPDRSEAEVVMLKRRKLGATKSWFSRRRGGQVELE